MLKTECRKWAVSSVKEEKEIKQLETKIVDLNKLREATHNKGKLQGLETKLEMKIEGLRATLRKKKSSSKDNREKLLFLKQTFGSDEIGHWLADLPELMEQEGDSSQGTAAPSSEGNGSDARAHCTGWRPDLVPVLRRSASDESLGEFQDCESETDCLLEEKREGGGVVRTVSKLQLRHPEAGVSLSQLSPTSDNNDLFEDARSTVSSAQSPRSAPSPIDFDLGCAELLVLARADGADRRPEPPPALRCVAIFNFRAEHPDELNMIDQEELEVVGDGDEEGWVRARNYKGEVGYVPKSYLEILEPKETRHSCDFLGMSLLQGWVFKDQLTFPDFLTVFQLKSV